MPDLESRLDSWTAAGLITREQAEAIRVAEAARRPPETSVGRVPIVTEILGYVGAALAFWAIAILTADVWADLVWWAQAGLFLLAAVAFFGGGSFIGESGEPAAGRLASVLWTCSVAALAAAAWITVLDLVEWSEEAATMTTGAISTGYAVALFIMRRRVLQHLVVFGSAAMLATGVAMFTSLDSQELAGLTYWGLGAVWLLVARRGLLPPGETGIAIGAATALFGAQIVAGSDVEAIGLTLGLVTAALLAVVGLIGDHRSALILGAAGIFLFVPQTVFHFFGDAAAALVALFVVGVALVAGAGLWARHRMRSDT